MSQRWRLDSSCVTVEPLDDVWCQECGEGPQTHEVIIDLGSQTRPISDRLCEGCAKELAEELRASLPAPIDDAATETEDGHDEPEPESFLCLVCRAELPDNHRGRCPFCGERP